MKAYRFEGPILLMALGVIVYQLFVPPLIGIADNWDFERLMGQNGLAHVSTDYNDKYFRYFNSRYRIVPITVPSDDLHAYRSSTSLPMRLARLLSIAVGQGEFLDIRFQAAIYTTLLLFGLWLILASTRALGTGLRIAESALIVVILTDVGYVSYFNSFYSEATAFALFIVAIGCCTTLISQQFSSVLLLICYFLASGLLVTSKPQYAPLVLVFAPLGIYITRHVRLARRYWLAATMAIALCLVGIWYYNQVPNILRLHGAYVEIFMDLLPNSTTPEQDLADLGLSADYARFSGTTPYQPDSPLNNPEIRDSIKARIKSLTIPLFYLRHPRRTYWLCARCVRHAFSTRAPRSGYYEESSGKPPYSQPFGVWSFIRERIFPRSVVFLAFFLITGIAAAVLLLKTSSATIKGLNLLYALFVCIAFAQFFISIIAGGGEPDLEKHLFMFNLAFDACIVLFVIGIVYSLQTRFRRGSGASRLN